MHQSILFSEHTQGVFPKQGTTSFLATVVFPKEHPEKTSVILSRLNEVVGKQGNGAIMEGIHAEVRGPAHIIKSDYVSHIITTKAIRSNASYGNFFYFTDCALCTHVLCNTVI